MKKHSIVIIIILLVLIFGNMLFVKVNAANEMQTTDETKVYFLSSVSQKYAKADCILLEKNGKFGLIDTGLENTAGKVINFLKAKGGENLELEFLLITHIHDDHIGGASKVLDNFTVKNLYIKQIDERLIPQTMIDQYTAVMKKAIERKVNIIGPENFLSVTGKDLKITNSYDKLKPFYYNSDDDTNTIFDFEGNKMQLYNWEIEKKDGKPIISDSENDRSICLLMTQGSKKAFFTGDMNNTLGTEDKIAPKIKEVDFLKLGHHGYTGSNTYNYLEILKPKYAMITNEAYAPYDKDTIEHLTKLGTEIHFSTQDLSSVILTITDNDMKITYENPNGYKYINGKYVYLENGNVIDKEPEIQTRTASSWDELYQIVHEGISANVVLDNKGDWTANKRIEVGAGQIIKLEALEDINIVRSEGYYNTLLANKGQLEINATNSTITIDGNSENIEENIKENHYVKETLISNYGNLKMQGNVTIKNNRRYKKAVPGFNVALSKGSGIYSSGILSSIELDGVKILNNEIYTSGSPKGNINFTNNDFSGQGAGIFCDSGSVHIKNSEISGNTITEKVNFQVENANKEKTLEYPTAVLIRGSGAGIYSQENSNFNIENSKIINNQIINNSTIKITSSLVKNIITANEGVGVNVTNLRCVGNIKNCEIANNVSKDNNTQITLTDSTYSNIELEQEGGGIYSCDSNLELSNTKIFNNILGINSTLTINGEESSSKVSKGGGVFLDKAGETDAKVKALDCTIESNGAYRGGGVYISNDKSFAMMGGIISSNVAEEKGKGVYQGGTFEISKNIQIDNNNEIYLEKPKYLTVKENLENDNVVTIDAPEHEINDIVVKNETGESVLNKFNFLVEGYNLVEDESKNLKVEKLDPTKPFDITDLLILKRHLIHGEKIEWKIPDDKLTRYDINKDEEVDITDLLLLRRVLLN